MRLSRHGMVYPEAIRNPFHGWGRWLKTAVDRRLLTGAFASLATLGSAVLAACGGVSPLASFKPVLFTATTTWTLWGDSLTELGYPPTLGALTGQNAVNEGVASQTSTEIATREGALPTTVAVTDNQIPTSGGVEVAFITGAPPADFVASGDLVIGTIAGVEGVTVQNSDGTYTFTPTLPLPAPVPVPAGTPWRPDLTGLNSGPIVIWAGRNNYNHPQQVLADIAAMVATVPSPQNYVVLGVINSDNPGLEYKGQPHYNTIIGINQSLAAAYPGHFYDIRADLVRHYDPTDPQDVIDYGHDVPPSSMKGINPYCAGTLTAPITSVSQTQISISNYDLCRTLILGTEKMEIMTFSAATQQPGIATVIRGYASTTPATYPVGTPYKAIDPLHITNATGSKVVAAAVLAAQKAQAPQ